MPYARSSGRMCAVVGCRNSQKDLFHWHESICDIHQEQHRDCPCLPPFKLHKFPSNEQRRKEWVEKLDLMTFVPKAGSVVCSIHFVDGKPTKNSVPELFIGYEENLKLAKKRHRKSASETELGKTLPSSTYETDEEDSSNDQPTTCDKSIQWEDPSLLDHSYMDYENVKVWTSTGTQTDLPCINCRLHQHLPKLPVWHS